MEKPPESNIKVYNESYVTTPPIKNEKAMYAAAADRFPSTGTLYANLDIESALITRKDNRYDNLCCLCGDWAVARSRCSDRYNALQCVVLENPRMHPFIVYACDECIPDDNDYTDKHIVFPDGRSGNVDCSIRVND